MNSHMQTLRTALDHLKAGRFDQCAALCRPLLDVEPSNVDARFFLGVCLGARGQLGEAIPHLQQTIAARPDHIDARRELCRMLQAKALILVDQGLLNEAIDLFGQAVAADPANAAAHANLSHALATEGRFDEALTVSIDALRLSPADIDININRAIALLKAGRLPEGWAANEWRHKKPGREKLPAALMLPKLRHLGEVIGLTIVIYHEEGFGDTIQFLRYAQMLAEAGARIILWAPAELARLMRGQTGIAEVLTGNVNLPKFDFHCPINSLPYIFGTAIGTVPADGAYIKADAALTAEWAARLPPGPRIGLVWAGEPRSYDPAAQALDRRRSLPFKMLLPLTVTPGLAFVSLQMGPARGQIAGGVHDPMGAVRDFADTAAIIANLDTVVSVDTAVAHLAAAMGKPVLLLDRYDNCWRWLHGRSDSPWYPSLIIFRQTRMGDWLGPVTEAAQALAEFFPEDGEVDV
jgi:tetratricopeptide (TPR) repeat protein